MSLVVENLMKKFGSRTVVKDVSMTVNKGQIVGLLGPNGAGKSTTFYMIIGLIKAGAGKVFLWDKDLSKEPMHKRCLAGIGYLPQEASVFRKMTVYDNIHAGLEFKSGTRYQKRSRVETLIAEFKLDHVRDSFGYSLSGGERRRVEIARCLARGPDYVLLDEPFAGIDPISIKDIQNMIFTLKEQGIGVLITDHNVRDTLKITDYAYIIGDGVVLAEGLPNDVIKNPDVISKYLGADFKLH